jgi:protein-L-isoaspartate O-methyltransferase
MTYTATYSPEDNKLRLYASSRLDKETYERVKAAGFHWAPKQDLFVAPMWTPAREDLLIELAGEVGDEDKSLVERQEERAERFGEYQESRTEDAEQARAAVHRIADGIPMGQPILVGHHSERHARKDAEKIENGMRRAVKMWETAQYWKDRAAGALRHAKYKELPAVRARRIKGIESDIRCYRARYIPSSKNVIMQVPWNSENKQNTEKVPHVFCAPRGGRGGSWVEVSRLPALEAYYARWIRHCELRLEYERAMLEEQGGTDLLKPKAREPQLPLCNYRVEGGLTLQNIWRRGETIHYPLLEMTQAEYAKINTDYKGTRLVGNSHRVRTAMRNHSLFYIFLTDAKMHTPPPPIAPKPKEYIVVDPGTWTPAQPQAEAFDAMKDSLKAGVTVITANQLFPTPATLATRMVEMACIEPDHWVLEPSAGTGNILAAMIPFVCETMAIEINLKLADGLRERFKNSRRVSVRCCDFLEQGIDLPRFDRILMNPPFENGSDIKHILHAQRLLKPGGHLVAICANGPRQFDKLNPLAMSWEVLPEGTFSGTGVRAVLLTLPSIVKAPSAALPVITGYFQTSLFPEDTGK